MHATRRPTRPGRRALGAATLALLLAGAACASEADDAADVVVDIPEGDTVAFLQEAGRRTSEGSYRMELRLSMSGEVDDDSTTVATGVVDGADSYMEMDFGAMFEEMAGEIPGGMGPMPPEVADLLGSTMEFALVDDQLYLRAPILAEAAGMLGLDELEDLEALRDGWGVIDVSALEDALPSEVAAQISGQSGPDPQALIEVVQGADDVEDLGTGQVQGEPAHGLSAEVSMADLMEAQGTDPGAFAAGGIGRDDEEAMAAMLEMAVPVEVWIDGEGYLVRISYTFSVSAVAEAMGEPWPAGMPDMAFPYAVDLFDHGEATLDFEPPVDAVDVTDAYAALLEL
ncbi:MAG: hypothetical protein FWJ94_11310 [Acidimicrobiia bacterium]